MADQISTQTQEMSALQDSIDKATQASQNLFSQATEASGNTQRSLLKLSQVFDAVAKNEAELLKTTNKINDAINKRREIQEKLTKAKGQEKDALQKQLADQDEILKTQVKQSEVQEKQIKAQKDFLGQLGQTKGLMSQMISSQVAQMGIYLASTASIMNGLAGIERSVKRVASISVADGSYFGMSGNFVKDLKDLGVAATSYSFNANAAAASAAALGISQEEANDAFQRFSRIAKDGSFGKSGSDMKELTQAASQLSVLLGTSLSETTDYMIQSQTKFGRTGAQTAETLFGLQQVTEKTNKEFGRTVIQGRDVTKVLFDIANESTSAAQDQKFLGQMIVANMAQLQAQGTNYDMALKTSATYIKQLTSQAPDWAKIFAGRNLAQSLGSSFESISPMMMATLEKAKPGISATLKGIYATSSDPYTLQQNLQGALQDTQVGMNAMQDEMLKVINIHSAQAQQRLMALYHISDPLQAQAQLKLLQTREKEQQFQKLTAQQAKEQYGISEATFEIVKRQGHESELSAIVQQKVTSEAAAAKKKQEADSKIADQERIKSAIKERDELEKKLKTQGGGTAEDQRLLQTLNANINAMQNPESNVSKSVKSMSDKLAGYVVASGGKFAEIKSWLTGDLAKIAGGAVTAVLMWRTGREQLSELKAIRQALSMANPFGGGGGRSGGGGLGGSGGAILRGGLSTVSKEAAQELAKNSEKLVFKEIEAGTKAAAIAAGRRAALRAGEKAVVKVGEKTALKTATKLGGKALLKSLPVLGNIADAGFALGDAWDIGKTYLGGGKIRGSQLARLAGDTSGFAAGFTGIGALGGGALGAAGDVSAALLEAQEAKADMMAAGGPIDMSGGGAGGMDVSQVPGAISGGGGGPGQPMVINGRVVRGTQGSSVEALIRIPTGDAAAFDAGLSRRGVYGS